MLGKHKKQLALAICRTPPIPTEPSFPLPAPLTLNFSILGRRGDQGICLFLLIDLHFMHASQLKRMSLTPRLENSLISKAYLAILKVIFEYNSSKDRDGSNDPIISFLSNRPKNSKQNNPPKNVPTLPKGPPNQNSAASAIELGQHQARPHSQ